MLGQSSWWNPLGWSRKFFRRTWRWSHWITQMPCSCTVSWTAPKKLLAPHWLLSGAIPIISWGGLRLRQGGCSWYGRASTISSSRRKYLIVLHSLQFQSALFELGGWPSWLCVAGRSCSSVKNWAHSSTQCVTFTGETSRSCANKLLEAWCFSRAFYIYRGVIKIPTLRRIILEVGNYMFSLARY